MGLEKRFGDSVTLLSAYWGFQIYGFCRLYGLFGMFPNGLLNIRIIVAHILETQCTYLGLPILSCFIGGFDFANAKIARPRLQISKSSLYCRCLYGPARTRVFLSAQWLRLRFCVWQRERAGGILNHARERANVFLSRASVLSSSAQRVH